MSDRGTPGWRIVGSAELRALWNLGLGSWAVLALALVLSAGTMVTSGTVPVNLLDARASASGLARLATGIGVLLAMLAGADAISGERERSTLEALLLTPTRSRDFVIGKTVAALSMWIGCFVVSVPYLAVLGRFLGVGASTIAVAAIVGGLAAVLLAAAGMWVSLRTSSNRASLGASLLVVAVLAFPGFLPASSVASGFGYWIVKIDPVSALLRFFNLVIVDQQTIAGELGWLVSPIVAAVIVSGATLNAGRKIALEPGR